MARVTVEDCAEVVPSRFELVALAAQRAKTIAAGGDITVERENDKNAVVALREIAGQTVNVEQLRENLVRSNQNRVNVDEFGVEQATESSINNEISVAAEAVEELQSLQQSYQSSSEDMIYGEEDISSDD